MGYFIFIHFIYFLGKLYGFYRVHYGSNASIRRTVSPSSNDNDDLFKLLRLINGRLREWLKRVPC